MDASHRIAKVLTPQEQELQRLQIELEGLEIELAQQELNLATSLHELHNFEQQYFQVVGARYAELDHLEAELAQYIAYLNPKDFRLRQRAEQARLKAKFSQEAIDEQATTPTKVFQPPESLKKLYREVAKRIHPDLVTEEAERQQRLNLMIQANQAYEQGDEQRLIALLKGWELRPEAVEGEGITAQVLRTRRKIEQVKQRIQAIAEEQTACQQSSLAQIRDQFQAAKTQGRDLLAEMALQIHEEIGVLSRQLQELKAKAGF